MAPDMSCKIENELSVIGFRTPKEREQFVLEAARFRTGGYGDDVVHFSFDELLKGRPHKPSRIVSVEEQFQPEPKRFRFQASTDIGDAPNAGTLSLGYRFFSLERPAIDEVRALSSTHPALVFILYTVPGKLTEYRLIALRGGEILHEESLQYDETDDPFTMMAYFSADQPWWKRHDVHSAISNQREAIQ